MKLDLRNIEWGTGETKTEIIQLKTEYEDIFVNIDDYGLIKEPHHLFIWGRRGSGKTAMAWKLSNVKYEKDFEVLKIDFEDAENWVNAVLAESGDLNKLRGFSLLKSCSDLWYNTILIELIRKLSQNKNINIYKRNILINYVKSLESQPDIVKSLLINIKYILKILEKGSFIDPISRSITEEGISAVQEHLHGSVDFIEAVRIFSHNLGIYPNIKFRIVVDSVDKWMISPNFIDKASEEFFVLSIVVRGLTRALIKIKENGNFNNSIEIKSFLPLDLKPYLDDRAAEHEAIYHHHMNWSSNELSAFISKRIAKSYQLIDSSGNYIESLIDTWDKFFPPYITNIETNVKHQSFDYLLRHSQFRPREILMCCRNMTEYAKKVNKETLNQEEFRDIIHQHCNVEVEKIINEFQPSFPNLRDVLNRFYGSPNILDYERAYEILKKDVSLPKPIKDTRELIQFLYDISFFGIILNKREKEERGKSLPYTRTLDRIFYFSFKFLDLKIDIGASRQLVIHPMFYGKFSIKADNKITICHSI